jgi:hypothetical protein
MIAMKRKASTLKLSNQKNPLGIGFSLNNPRRVGAHTGEPQTQTPFRGLGVVGYGSSSARSTITLSQYICVDKFDVPHVSVKNTRGYLSTKNKWLNRGYPYTVVKDCKPSYDSYLQKKKGNIAKQSTNVQSGSCICPNSGQIGNYQKDILNMNYKTYYQTNIFKKECIPLPPSKAHYPPQNVRPNSACNVKISLEDFLIAQAVKTQAGEC